MPHPCIRVEPAPAGSPGPGWPGSGPPGFLRVRLARPERRNALDAAMTRELLARGAAGTSSVKLIASAGGLLERLRAERAANRAAWGST